jgi:cation channel sperm-associated protein 4
MFVGRKVTTMDDIELPRPWYVGRAIFLAHGLGLTNPFWGWPTTQDGWNILNFIIVFVLLMGFIFHELDVCAITYTVR